MTDVSILRRSRVPSLQTALQAVDSSFERFCLAAGIRTIEQMLCEDAQRLAGAPHDLLVIQIDGLHIGDDTVLVAALGIDGEGHKHPLGLVEGATGMLPSCRR